MRVVPLVPCTLFQYKFYKEVSCNVMPECRIVRRGSKSIDVINGLFSGDMSEGSVGPSGSATVTSPVTSSVKSPVTSPVKSPVTSQ